MYRFTLATALLIVPTAAHAIGVGTTAHITGMSFDGGLWAGAGYLPSLDLYPSETVRIRINALDTLAWLLEDSDQIYLGGDFTITALRVDAFPNLEGVIQPGGSLDIYSNFGEEIVIGGLCRVGMEGGGTMRGGLYVVPGLGVAAGDGYDGAVWSGAVELSLWFGNAGRRGGSAPR